MPEPRPAHRKAGTATGKATPSRSPRGDDTLGSGLESGIVVLIFAGIGYGLDRWLDTSPILTLVLFALGAVGIFYRYKAAYTMRMDAHAEERRRSGGDRS